MMAVSKGARGTMETVSQYEEMARQCERYAASRRFKADTDAWNAVARMWRELAATVQAPISTDRVIEGAAEGPPFGFPGRP